MGSSDQAGRVWSDLGVITVLVADAQRMFSGALAAALGQNPELAVLDERPVSGADAVEAIKIWKPEVALIDQWLDAVAATKQLRADVPSCKVLFLSWMFGPAQVREALDSGAAGFLPKSLPLDRVAKAVILAHEGEPVVYPGELKRLMRTLDQRDEKAREFARRLESLSDRELEVLILLSRGKLISDVGKELHLVPGTVTGHINRILKKTGARSQAELLAMARLAGAIQT